MVDVGGGHESGPRADGLGQGPVVVVAGDRLVRQRPYADLDTALGQQPTGLEPGVEIGPVVGIRHEDLVPVPEVRHEPVTGDRTQALGGAAGEVDGGAARFGVVEELLDPFSSRFHEVRGPVGPGVGAAAGVGVRRREVRLDGLQYGTWLLGRGRAVEIRQLRMAGDDGKLFSHLPLPERALTFHRGRRVCRTHSRTSGAPASRQATIPPARLRTSGWPIRVSAAAKRSDFSPTGQASSTGVRLLKGSPPRSRSSNTSSTMLTEPSMCRAA